LSKTVQKIKIKLNQAVQIVKTHDVKRVDVVVHVTWEIFEIVLWFPIHRYYYSVVPGEKHPLFQNFKYNVSF